MLPDDEVVRENPWWRPGDWQAGDSHLRRLAERPARLPAPQVDVLDLSRPAVHILRGPRQVGKSTDLKLLVERALDEGFSPSRIVYLPMDMLEGQTITVLVDSVRRAYELAGSARSPRLLLLDEVTAADRWQRAVKVLWDEGTIDRDIVVCTGSSTLDLAEGAAERLPGRRGSGRDLLVLPQDFGAFAAATDGSLSPGLGMSIEDMLTEDGRAALLQARIDLPALRRALERYLQFGGLPAAVAEAVAGADRPSEEVTRVLSDSMIREIQRKGASMPAAHALMERVMRSLGSKVSWRRMAEEMTVPLTGQRARRRGDTDPRTLQSYIELLAACYIILVVYYWRPDAGSADLSRDKKVYFGDPLMHTIVADRLALKRDVHADIENAVALALFRRYEPAQQSAETFIEPERLHVWGTRGGEIDFVCGRRESIHAVEVADWRRVDRRKATAPARALPGRPAIVVTRSDLELGPTANLIPAPLALWALSG